MWYCVVGMEKDVVDVEESWVYKLFDDLYFFFWIEIVMLVELIVVIDFKEFCLIG